jgi:hypothetical protein
MLPWLLSSANNGRPKLKWYNARLGTAEQRHQLKPTLQAWHRSAQKWGDEIDQIKSIETQEQPYKRIQSGKPLAVRALCR